MRLFSIFIFLLLHSMSYAQPMADSLNSTDKILLDVRTRQVNMTRIGMTSLNVWAASNITLGSIGFYQNTGKQKYFHQMNVFWNVVNFGIGIPGLLSTYKKDELKGFEDIYKEQKRYEKVYLVNMGIDVGYVAAGWALDNFGKTKTGELGDRFKGYGNSLVMQGTYLFVHDIFLYFMYKTNNKRLDLVWKNVTIQPTGFGVVVKFK